MQLSGQLHAHVALLRNTLFERLVSTTGQGVVMRRRMNYTSLTLSEVFKSSACGNHRYNVDIFEIHYITSHSTLNTFL
jgi:hypothetical protein